MTDKFRIFLQWRDKEGKVLPESIQRMLQGFVHIVIPLYNVAAEALNPHYAKWNSEYDESKDGKYEDYIASKMNSVIATTEGVNNAMFKTEVMILDDDGPQICFKHKEGGSCSLLMKPIE